MAFCGTLITFTKYAKLQAMFSLGKAFRFVRLAIKVVGFIDGLLDESDREKAREQEAKEAARKKMSDIANFAANNVVKGEPNGR